MNWNETIQKMLAKAPKPELPQSEITLTLTVPTEEADGVAWELERLCAGHNFSIKVRQK